MPDRPVLSYFPSVDFASIPAVSAEEMKKVDQMAVNGYGLQLLQMMENAGRCLASTARDWFFNGNVTGRRILVLAGTGGNGGGALAAARRLSIWGADLLVLFSDFQSLSAAAAVQWKILNRMGVRKAEGEPGGYLRDVELFLDGLIGYSLRGVPRGRMGELIDLANTHAAPVLALDVPSGLDSTSGEVFEPAIRADATLTLALPKSGLFRQGVDEISGECFLADIGIPLQVYMDLGIDAVPSGLFSKNDILHLRR